MVKIINFQTAYTNQFLALFREMFAESFAYYPEELKQKTLTLWTKERLQKRLKNPDYQVFLAIEKSRVVGFLAARFRPQAQSSYINWMGVDSAFRGQRIGSSLIKHWEVWARERGATTLSISTTNPRNTAYYQKLGYKLVSEETTKHNLTKYRLKK